MRTLLLSLLIVCTPAFAAKPPPDPSRGERFDGRRSDPAAARREAALAVPRALLVLPRLLWRAIWVPIGIGARFVERHYVFQRVLAAITSRDGLVGVRPAVSVITGIQPIFGLSYFNLRALGPRTELRATLAGNVADVITAGFLMRPTSLWGAAQYTLSIDYTYRDDFVYSGIGFETAREGRVGRYSANLVDVHSVVHLGAHSLVSFYADGAFGLRRFGNGIFVYGDPPIADVYCTPKFAGRCLSSHVSEAEVPGFNTGTQFLRATLGMRVDTRDSISAPSQGVALDLRADYSHGLGGDEPSYFRLHGILEAALDLWQRSRVLVVRLQAGTVLPTAGSAPVPFTELYVLGLPEVHRGVRFGRYRDASLFLATAEYRWPVAQWMDAALFVDYGGVFGPRFSGFSFDKLIPAVGGALRIRTSQQLLMRLQLAYGWYEGTVITFTASAF